MAYIVYKEDANSKYYYSTFDSSFKAQLVADILNDENKDKEYYRICKYDFAECLGIVKEEQAWKNFM